MGGSIDTAAEIVKQINDSSWNIPFLYLQVRVGIWLGKDDGILVLSPERCLVAACVRGQQTFTADNDYSI